MRLSRRLSYAVPVAIVAAVAAVVAVPRAASSAGRPTLPARSAESLLAAMQSSRVDHFSGTVVTVAHLGLPELPEMSGGLSGFTSLLTGAHTMRVSYRGPEQQRIGILSQLREREVVHNGRDVWTYDSATLAVTHDVLPASVRADDAANAHTEVLPQDAARQLLARITPTTVVRVDNTARVAGRAAYQLLLEPRQADVLIRSVRIAIDAATFAPLRVQVFGRSNKPALQIGFTHITYAEPRASTFAFRPPPGSHLVSSKGSLDKQAHNAPSDAPAMSGVSAHIKPRVIGHGWAVIAELPASLLPANGVGLLHALGSAVPGGSLVRTSLLSVLRTDDGRLFIGSVTPDVLQRAAGLAG